MSENNPALVAAQERCVSQDIFIARLTSERNRLSDTCEGLRTDNVNLKADFEAAVARLDRIGEPEPLELSAILASACTVALRQSIQQVGAKLTHDQIKALEELYIIPGHFMSAIDAELRPILEAIRADHEKCGMIHMCDIEARFNDEPLPGAKP